MSLFTTLRSAASPEWAAYIHHEFVTELGAGTLPLEAFQRYLVQDYLFLIQFARANALAAYKSTDIEGLRQSQAALAAIVDETQLHIRFCEGWGISESELNQTPETSATIAYTRYVLDVGQLGDVLDLKVALAPCVIGYAEIGRNLQGKAASPDAHPYAEWIHEYAGDEFQATAQMACDDLDRLGAGLLTDKRLEELSHIFRTATRLEAEFWQQALDG